MVFRINSRCLGRVADEISSWNQLEDLAANAHGDETSNSQKRNSKDRNLETKCKIE